MHLRRVKNQLSNNRLVLGLVILIYSLLVACGGGSSDPDTSSQNNNPSTPISDLPTNSKQYSGVVQKGPFNPDSVIRVTKLSNAGKPTNQFFTTSTEGTSGNFSFDLPEDWSQNHFPLELSATGRFLDETLGNLSNDAITLNTLLAEPENLSINLITHWTSLRAKVLLHKERLSFTKALKQANSELEAITGISNASQLDITQSIRNESDNAQLLLLSGALLDLSKKYSDSHQNVINQIGADFAQNGALNNEGGKWFKRIQLLINNNPAHHISLYSQTINEASGSLIHKAPNADSLPLGIAIAAKPQAIAPEVIYALPGETVTLDGSGSHDSGNIINSTWFRIDQQEQFIVPISDKFFDSPTIVVPNQECQLLFALIVTDEEKLTDTTVVKVIVRIPEEPNESPIANSQNVVTLEDTPIDIVITGIDPENQDLHFDVGSTPLLLSHGILEGNAPNVRYTPSANYFGEDSFEFTVNDALNTSEKATVGITILPVNDKPVADPQSVTTNENTSISIGLTGSDIENDPLTFQLVTSTTNGSLNLSSLPRVVYTPATNFTGTDQFTFVANDGTDLSEPATVDITVLPANGRPLAFTQSVETPQETPVNIFLRGTDIDGDPLVYTVLTDPNNGTLTGTAPNLTYHPNIGYIGIDGFTFKVNDGVQDSNISPVSIRVIPEEVNRAPTANPLSVSTEINTPVSLLLSGTDPDGDVLSYVLFSSPANGVLTGTEPNLSYQPNTGFTGTDMFFFAVNDGKVLSSLALVEITVNPIGNIPPIANAGTNQIVVVNPDGSSSNTTQLVTLSGSGTDSDGTVNAYQWMQLAGPPIILSDPSVTSPSLTTPLVAISTTEILVFQLVVTDDDGADSAPDEVMISINLNQAPVANAGDNQNVGEDELITLNGSGYDPEDDSNVSYEWMAPLGITLSDSTIANPSFTTPMNLSSSQTFTFSLVVTDTFGLSSIADTVDILVSPPGNLPPVALISGPNSVFVDETIKLDGSASFDSDGTIVSYDWATSTGDTDSGSTVNFTAPSVAGTISIELTVEDDDGAVGKETIEIDVLPLINQPPVADAGIDQSVIEGETVTLMGSGTDPEDGATSHFEWTPPTGITLSSTATADPMFEAPVVSSTPITLIFTLIVRDSQNLASAPDTVEITINPIGVPPVSDAGDDQTEGFNGEVNTIYLDGTKSRDPDGLTDGSDLIYSWRVISSVFPVSLSDANSAIPSFDVSSAPATIILELKVTDTSGLMDTDTITINIQSPPESRDATIEIDPLKPLPITLFGDDPDGDNGDLVYRIIDEPLFGFLNFTGTLPDNTVEYTSFSIPSEDSFTYQIEDSQGLFSKIATITLLPPNGAPIANTAVIDTFNNTVTIDLNDYSSDPDGDALEFEIFPGSINAPFVTFDFSNLPLVVVSDPLDRPVSGSFDFKVRDIPGGLESNIATITARFIPIPNQPPTADAGSDQIGIPSFRANFGSLTVEQTTFTLDGAKSSDPEEAPPPDNDQFESLNYKWTQISGPVSVPLIDDLQKPTILVSSSYPPSDPSPVHVYGDYVFELVVTDNDFPPLSSAPSRVTVTVDPP